MENIFYLIIVMFSIIGWYVLIKEILNAIIYKNIKFDSDIKLYAVVKNKENNIEILTRKLMYLQDKLGYFNKIEIIDENSEDETYKILEKMQNEYSTLKVRKIL